MPPDLFGFTLGQAGGHTQISQSTDRILTRERFGNAERGTNCCMTISGIVAHFAGSPGFYRVWRF